MTTSSVIPVVRRALLADGGLALEYDPALRIWVERWLPRIPEERPRPETAAAVIRVGRGSGARLASPGDRPLLTLGTVTLWLPAGGERAVLRGRSPGAGGEVDLAGREAHLTVADGEPAGGADLYSMLTLSAGLLLGRLGRTPVHAAAVLAPSGSALLLAGDARAGKSTTTINLISAGWDYLSDDQVVLSPEGAAIGVEGWPRPFHLDEGWERGEPTGRRRTVDASTLGPGRWCRAAPLGGLLFPEVRAEEPTRLEPMTPARAFAGLVRQSPWLIVDRVSSAVLLQLLSDVSLFPAYRLVLGLDSYRDPARLVRSLETGGPDLVG